MTSCYQNGRIVSAEIYIFSEDTLLVHCPHTMSFGQYSYGRESYSSDYGTTIKTVGNVCLYGKWPVGRGINFEDYKCVVERMSDNADVKILVVQPSGFYINEYLFNYPDTVPANNASLFSQIEKYYYPADFLPKGQKSITVSARW